MAGAAASHPPGLALDPGKRYRLGNRREYWLPACSPYGSRHPVWIDHWRYDRYRPVADPPARGPLGRLVDSHQHDRLDNRLGLDPGSFQHRRVGWRNFWSGISNAAPKRQSIHLILKKTNLQELGL